MPERPRPSRWLWILVPVGLGTLLALALLVFGDARHAEAADLGDVTDALSGGTSVVPAPPQPVVDVVDQVVTTVDPAVDVVSPVVDPVVDPVLGVAGPVVDPVLDPVLGVVAPVVQPIVDIVDPAIPTGPVIAPVVPPTPVTAPVAGIGVPGANPGVEPLLPVVGRVVPPSGGHALLPTGADSGTQPLDAPSGTVPSSTPQATASITIDPALSPFDLPTLPPVSNEPFAPFSSSTSASGGVPFQLLLFGVAAMLAAFLASRARRLWLLGAMTPRFALVSLTERPG
jgi:hypothetical protein